MALKRFEEIRFALFSINSMHTAALNGYYSEAEAKEIAIKCWDNQRLTREEVLSYFGNHEFRKEEEGKINISILDEPTPQWVHDKMAKECWEALEYFNMI